MKTKDSEGVQTPLEDRGTLKAADNNKKYRSPELQNLGPVSLMTGTFGSGNDDNDSAFAGMMEMGFV